MVLGLQNHLANRSLPNLLEGQPPATRLLEPESRRLLPCLTSALAAELRCESMRLIRDRSGG